MFGSKSRLKLGEQGIIRNKAINTPLGLAITISRLNSRLRRDGVSAHELWTQRNQFTQEQLPLEDREIILNQHQTRQRNHPYSEKSKTSKRSTPIPQLKVGDLVYLPSDHDKTQPRNRYLVVSIDKPWCLVRKFSGNQLRASPYKVRISECHLVPNQIPQAPSGWKNDSDTEDDAADSILPAQPTNIPPTLSLPGPQKPPSQYSASDVDSQTRPRRNRQPPKYLADYET